MKACRNAGLVVLLAFCLAGCDISYGVSRRADKIGAISPVCIENTLKGIKGVSDVQVIESNDPGIVLFGPGMPITHYYYYSLAGVNHPSISTAEYSDGKFFYEHEYSNLHKAPPQEQVNVVLPVMRAIDQTIAATCHAPDLSKIKESCSGGITCH